MKGSNVIVFNQYRYYCRCYYHLFHRKDLRTFGLSVSSSGKIIDKHASTLATKAFVQIIPLPNIVFNNDFSSSYHGIGHLHHMQERLMSFSFTCAIVYLYPMHKFIDIYITLWVRSNVTNKRSIDLNLYTDGFNCMKTVLKSSRSSFNNQRLILVFLIPIFVNII